MKNTKQAIYYGLVLSGSITITGSIVQIDETTPHAVTKRIAIIAFGLVLCFAGLWVKWKYKLSDNRWQMPLIIAY